MEERRLQSILAHLSPRPLCSHTVKIKEYDGFNPISVHDTSGYGTFDEGWNSGLIPESFHYNRFEQSQPQSRIVQPPGSKSMKVSSSEQGFRQKNIRIDTLTRLQGDSSQLGMEICRGLESFRGETSDEMVKNDIKDCHVQTEHASSVKQRCLDQSLDTSCNCAPDTRFSSGNKDDCVAIETEQDGGNQSTSEAQSLADQKRIVTNIGEEQSNSDGNSQYQDGRNMDKFHKFQSQFLERMSIRRNNAMTGESWLYKEDCIFCCIAQGRSPAFKLYEDDVCVCFLDMHPLTPGHSLLIPKGHFPTLELTPPEVAAAMCATVPILSTAIMRATNCEAFNLLVNTGKAAGQVVFHTHFHIIPRRSSDNLWRSEGAKRRLLPLDNETSVLAQRIRCNIQDNR